MKRMILTLFLIILFAGAQNVMAAGVGMEKHQQTPEEYKEMIRCLAAAEQGDVDAEFTLATIFINQEVNIDRGYCLGSA